ncbi:MAG: twin-arginine translocation signal domain-containing protein, partial [Bacteroidales bacterium]|nr:twin-arginine translocation signal domain-containing protein [Bacteroidales bacterium]
MGEKITRRDFLAKSGLLAGAAFSGNVLNAKDNPAREGKTAGIPEVYGPWLKFRPDGTFKIA